MTRTILAFLVAPFASALLQGAVMGNFGAFVFGLLMSAVFVLFLGVPAYFLFRKYGWLKLWQTIVGGVGLSLVAALVVSLDFGISNYTGRSTLLGLGFFALHGFLVALVFWFVALFQVSSNTAFNPDAQRQRAG